MFPLLLVVVVVVLIAWFCIDTAFNALDNATARNAAKRQSAVDARRMVCSMCSHPGACAFPLYCRLDERASS